MSTSTECISNTALTKTVISTEDGSRWTLTLDVKNGVGKMIPTSDSDSKRKNTPEHSSSAFELPGINQHYSQKQVAA